MSTSRGDAQARLAERAGWGKSVDSWTMESSSLHLILAFVVLGSDGIGKWYRRACSPTLALSAIDQISKYVHHICIDAPSLVVSCSNVFVLSSQAPKSDPFRPPAQSSRAVPYHVTPNRPRETETHEKARMNTAPCSPYTFSSTAAPLQRYDFWYLARAPGPPNFLGSHRLLSATSSVRSYWTSACLSWFFECSSTYFW